MEIFALVGGSGTGKSHRASLLAHEFDIDIMIDDGLAIKDGKILSGRSAKREETRIAAARRAMFVDSEHARSVRATICELKPERILILGTSRAMIDRITAALNLPSVNRYINIDEVASSDEIRKALRVRREQGKHVIPAPTFEVKRTFSGYLVHPLRLKLFGRGLKRAVPVEVDKSVVRPTYSSLGKYSIADTVINAIIRHTARDIDGVIRVGRVGVEPGDEGIVLRLEVVLGYGCHLPSIAETIQSRVSRAIQFMTALNVLTVIVVIKDVAVDESKGG